jgi:hypothetical protein
MPATVVVGTVKQALFMKNEWVWWFLVARTETPWPNENEPPSESIDTSSLSEVGGYQKAETVSLCKEDPNGSIEFQGQKYSLVTDADAYTERARWIYASTILKFDIFPVVTFRQFGTTADLTPAQGHENDNVLLPNQVSDPGKLLAYVNHPPIIRTSSSKNVLEMVIEILPKVT